MTTGKVWDRVWQDLVGSGWIWLDLVGFGCIWLDLVGTGWIWWDPVESSQMLAGSSGIRFCSCSELFAFQPHQVSQTKTHRLSLSGSWHFGVQCCGAITVSVTAIVTVIGVIVAIVVVVVTFLIKRFLSDIRNYIANPLAAKPLRVCCH